MVLLPLLNGLIRMERDNIVVRPEKGQRQSLSCRPVVVGQQLDRSVDCGTSINYSSLL